MVQTILAEDLDESCISFRWGEGFSLVKFKLQSSCLLFLKGFKNILISSKIYCCSWLTAHVNFSTWENSIDFFNQISSLSLLWWLKLVVFPARFWEQTSDAAVLCNLSTLGVWRCKEIHERRIWTGRPDWQEDPEDCHHCGSEWVWCRAVWVLRACGLGEMGSAVTFQSGKWGAWNDFSLDWHMSF